MRRGRFVVVFVALCLTLPEFGSQAEAATETSVECGFTSEVRTDGFDGSTAVANYTVRATWCVETTYETRTITEDPDPELSGTSDEAKVDNTKKDAKKGRGKKARRRAKRRANKKEQASAPVTRTERRVVKTCMTDFQLDALPRTLVDGAGLIGVTTTELPGEACSSRSVRVRGRFAREYVPGLQFVPRGVVQQTIGGVTVENYPLGRVAYFDIAVHFARDGGATCERCVPNFRFCDVRLASGDDAGCVHL